MIGAARYSSFLLALAVAGTALGENSQPNRKLRCEAGSRPGVRGCVASGDRVKFRAALGVPAKTDSRDRTKRAPAPPEDLRTPAPSPLKAQRDRKLIEEIARLERLVKSTPVKSPDRPLLVRRLADGYAELAAVAERKKLEAEIAASEAAKKLRSERRGASKDAATDKL